MSKILPYYKMYVADAETDENFRAMDDAELGFYWRCLNHSWINGGIPADPEERSRVITRPRKIADQRWKRVGRCFVPSDMDPTRLVNLRQERERLDAQSKSESATKSVSMRKDRVQRSIYERKTNDPIRVSESEFGSLVRNSGREGPGENPLYDRYHDFIAEWPSTKRTGFDEGGRQWLFLVDRGEITEANIHEVFEGLERHKTCEQWIRENGKFIPAIANSKGDGWLQMRRWKDQPQQPGEDSKWQ